MQTHDEMLLPGRDSTHLSVSSSETGATEEPDKTKVTEIPSSHEAPLAEPSSEAVTDFQSGSSYDDLLDFFKPSPGNCLPGIFLNWHLEVETT